MKRACIDLVAVLCYLLLSSVCLAWLLLCRREVRFDFLSVSLCQEDTDPLDSGTRNASTSPDTHGEKKSGRVGQREKPCYWFMHKRLFPWQFMRHDKYVGSDREHCMSPTHGGYGCPALWPCDRSANRLAPGRGGPLTHGKPRRFSTSTSLPSPELIRVGHVRCHCSRQLIDRTILCSS